ncbi:MAG: DegT/DnrJ/EryC1/StrS family aminotransferase [Gammaproteobacteria bacterium]|nr:DegT/DnrJ/EryC1/StrS family aminotransferase [Gammaproteobacteria bacterium]
MTVPLLDLKPQYQALRAELDEALLKVAAAQMFILGPAVRELEEQVAAYCGARYGIGMSSGTDALLAALMALDIGRGDEVITTTYTFFATGGTIARLGARPVFLDIEPDTFNLSVERVEEFLDRCVWDGDALRNPATGGRVRALMPVHLYGQSADLEPLLALARAHGLAVIEDAAQAIGAEYAPARRVGALGDIGCLSFFPTKNLGAFGDAGLCVTNDEALAGRLRQTRVHGMEPRYYHAFIGGNFRLDEIQAAVLLVKLRHLENWHAARQRNAVFYDRALAAAGLSGCVRTPVARPGRRHVYNQYVIRVPRRDELRQYLAGRGVGTEVYYPLPLHLQQCFADLGGRPGDCPEAERAARETLALPIWPELSEAQLRHVVTSISDFLARG